MTYLVAAVFFLAFFFLWLLVDYIARKKGYQGINEREGCGSCTCHDGESCRDGSADQKDARTNDGRPS